MILQSKVKIKKTHQKLVNNIQLSVGSSVKDKSNNVIFGVSSEKFLSFEVTSKGIH